MATLNVSMPDTLRDYVEGQAEKGRYSTSEYIRHLIREDQKRNADAERDRLWELLAVSARQLDDGDFSDATADDVISRGRARRGA